MILEKYFGPVLDTPSYVSRRAIDGRPSSGAVGRRAPGRALTGVRQHSEPVSDLRMVAPSLLARALALRHSCG